MAHLKVHEGEITLHLSHWEKLGSFHGDLKMPISEIESFKSVSNPWKSEIMKGFRAPGTGFPYLIMLGTLRNFRGWRAFCAIYRKRPAVVINFKAGKFNRWIVTTDDMENLKTSLSI